MPPFTISEFLSFAFRQTYIKSFIIKLSKEEKAAVKKEADLTGLWFSAFARQRLRIAAARELQDVGLKVEF